jgi:putative Mn2+ efflux pump MntP
MSTVYKGAATYGKYLAYFGVFTSILGGILSVIIGIWFVYTSTTSTKRIKVSGKVIEADKETCIQSTCDYVVEYIYNNNTFQYDFKSSKTYNIGVTIDVYVYASDPSNVSLTSTGSDMWMGIGLIVFGIISPILAYYHLQWTKKSKGYAAFSGTSSILKEIASTID